MTWALFVVVKHPYDEMHFDLHVKESWGLLKNSFVIVEFYSRTKQLYDLGVFQPSCKWWKKWKYRSDMPGLYPEENNPQEICGSVTRNDMVPGVADWNVSNIS